VRLQDLRVLVVDDNATNRLFLKDLLTAWHMRPTVVDGGPAALAALREAAINREPFALVLLDLMMPDMDGFQVAEEMKQHPELARATVMMLSSAGQREDASRCRELGLAAYLTKPITPSDLLDAIATALRPAVEPQAPPEPAAQPRPAGRGLRILLAEDNPINQKLAVRLLEKQGHAVRVVGNGNDALAALGIRGQRSEVRGQRSEVRSQKSEVRGQEGEGRSSLTSDLRPLTSDFDLVLMDVQMPELDGFETTALIRKWEHEGGAPGRHLPIIAMTAYAMKGDRERCLAAGMDDYVGKPIQAQELFAAIGRVLPEPRQLEADSPAPPSASAVFNQLEALDRVGGDRQLFGELVELFFDTYPPQLTELGEAIAQRDCLRVQRLAHTLRGAAVNFCAETVAAAAQRLENMGRAGDLTDAAETYEALTEALNRLRPALAAFGTAESGVSAKR
jgi:CheY-like chemotaxis protein